MAQIELTIYCPKCGAHEEPSAGTFEIGKQHEWGCPICNCEVQFYVSCYDKDVD